jgi:hypothetical protein
MSLLLSSYLTLAAGVAVLASRGLVADGAFYFITLLESGRPSTFEHGRLAAHALTQWPVVLALHLGITDFIGLRLVHSAGLYYLGPLHLLVCWWFLPAGRKEAFFWPLLSLFAGSINAWLTAMTEAHVMTWLFWPLVLFMARGDDRRRSHLVVVGLLALASVTAYETMALQGLLLAGLAFVRAAKARELARKAWAAVAVWFLVGVAVAVYFSVNPRSVENRGGFAVGLLRFAGTGPDDLNYPVLLSLAILAAIVATLLVGPLSARVFQTLMAAIMVVGIMVAMSPVFAPASVRAIQQFQARAWVGLLPVALALLMFWMDRRKIDPAAFGMAVAMLVVLGLAQTTWQTLATAQWHGYTRVFKEEMSRQPGFIPYETTGLIRERSGIQVLNSLTWNYTNPYMSIALAPAGHVSAIIGVPRGQWQPFDPRDPKALPELSRYGVDYSSYRQALAGR